MAGRTVSKYLNIYVDGYDVTGTSRSVGPLSTSFDEIDLTLVTRSRVICPAMPPYAGALNVVMDNTATTGFHTVFSASPGALRNLMVAVGIQAAPAAGDPVFMAQLEQKDYMSADGLHIFNMSFDMPSEASTTLAYPNPWGHLLRSTAAAATAANSAVGIDDDWAGSRARKALPPRRSAPNRWKAAPGPPACRRGPPRPPPWERTSNPLRQPGTGKTCLEQGKQAGNACKEGGKLAFPTLATDSFYKRA